MIEPRIYRAAFIPALLAVVVAMFSLESRPSPLPQGLAADVLFDGRIAMTDAKRIVAAHRDRRPGTIGNRLTAVDVAAKLRAQRFAVTLDRFKQEGETLVNVVARRPGASPRQVVVVASRDAASVPDEAGSAADTAALAEIARTLEGRATAKTLVLASLDASTLGGAGATRLARDLTAAGPVEAVVVLSNLAAPEARGTVLITWSQSTARTGLGLQRTAANAVRQELEGGAGKSPGTGGQLARLAFPLGLGDQAPLVDAGVNALRLSGSGELPPKKGSAADPERLGSLGRAALRLMSTLDASEPLGEKPEGYILVGQNVVPEWAIALLVAALILPALVGSIDSFARVRRRREAVVPWLRWVLACSLPFLVALAVAEFLALVGQAPDAPPAPIPPGIHPLDAGAAVSLAICTLFFAAAWIAGRPLLAGVRRPDFGSPAAGAALALVLVPVVIAVWAVNPFAALLLVPALHLWLLATAAPAPPGRASAAAIVLCGAAMPALVAAYFLVRLSLDPLAGLWYLFLLVTGHHAGLYTSLVGALFLGCLVAAAAIVGGRRTPKREAPERTGPALRGPGGYAGPGSLGGTESALRR